MVNNKGPHKQWDAQLLRGGSRIFLRRGAPLRNGITDWCGKQVLKANTKKKALSQRRCAPPATNQLNLEPLTFRTLFKGSLMCLLYV